VGFLWRQRVAKEFTKEGEEFKMGL